MDQHQYLSFLIRCQKTSTGEIRVRLLNIQTGQEVAVVLLDEIPEQIRHSYLQADFSGGLLKGSLKDET